MISQPEEMKQFIDINLQQKEKERKSSFLEKVEIKNKSILGLVFTGSAHKLNYFLLSIFFQSKIN